MRDINQARIKQVMWYLNRYNTINEHKSFNAFCALDFARRANVENMISEDVKRAAQEHKAND